MISSGCTLGLIMRLQNIPVDWMDRFVPGIGNDRPLRFSGLNKTVDRSRSLRAPVTLALSKAISYTTRKSRGTTFGFS